MAGNDDLHPILSNIHETIGDVLKAVQRVKGEVEKVHESVTEAAETIRDAIHESIQAQAELKMMEHVVEVRSILPQIEAENERIDVEQEELDTQLDRIADRYERKHEELDETAADRIRNLGSHIFEIDEEQFEDGIESPFAEHVTTAWMALQAHNDAVERDRRDQVESTTGEVVSEIHEFVQQQNDLVDRIENVRTDVAEPVTEPKTLQLPYYTIEVEVGGTKRTHVVGPSVVDQSSSGTLRSLPGVDELVSGTAVDRTRTETLDSGTLRSEVEAAVDDGPPLVSYSGAVESAMPDGLEVAVEGGD